MLSYDKFYENGWAVFFLMCLVGFLVVGCLEGQSVPGAGLIFDVQSDTNRSWSGPNPEDDGPEHVDWAELPALPASGLQSADLWDEGINEDELRQYDADKIEAYRGSKREMEPLKNLPAPPGTPNIVVVIADDLPRGILGFEGNNVIKTPRLDQLAATGVRFDNYYLPLGQCGPSRTVLWTSLYPTASGVETNGHIFDDASTKVLPLWLRQHGYRTGFFGKCHIGTDNPGSLDVDWHFDRIFHTEGGGIGPNAGQIDLWNSHVILNKPNNTPYNPTHFTKMITDEAIQFAQQPSDKPFFMWVAHRAPHPQTLWDTGPNNAWASAPPGSPYYTVDQMPTALHPAKAGDTLAGKPPQQRLSPSRFGFDNIAAKPGGIREHMRRAHEQVHFMDSQVGALMDALAATGELENTIFVFTSDNGAFFGERGLCFKGNFFYDELVRVPLLMRWPAGLNQGVVSDALVQSTDLAQTLLDAVGLPQMPGNSGKSFWDVAQGNQQNHRRSVFFQYHSQKHVTSKIRGVLKDGYKLSHHLATYYFSEPHSNATAVPLTLLSPFTWELYDLHADPNELTNVLPYEDFGGPAMEAKLLDPGWRPRLNDLLRTLAQYQTEAEDDEGILLTSVHATRSSAESAVITWQSLKAKLGVPVNASTEVVWREAGCPNCTVYEVDHKIRQPNHSVTLTGLTPGVAYEALLFSMTTSSNGGAAAVMIPAGVGGSAGAQKLDSVSLDYRTQGYQTQVQSASDPIPLPEGLCLVTGGAGAVLVEESILYGACIDHCRLRAQTNPNRMCTWNGNTFQMPSKSLCEVYGGAGLQLVHASLSQAECVQQCTAFTATNPNSGCSWHGESFQEHASGLCRIIGGAGAELYIAGQSSKQGCVQQCGAFTKTNPNSACFWAEIVLQAHPTGACFIEGGCGAVLYDQIATSYECYKQCQAFQGTNPNSACQWNGQVTHVTPKGTCKVVGGAGKLLYNDTTKKCDCVQQCTSITTTNPNSACYWNEDVFQEHASGLCRIIGGAGAELYIAGQSSKQNCVLECASFTKTNPNSACHWAENVLQAHPTGACLIKGGCGVVLYDQSTTSYECNQQCQAFQGSNPNSACRWKGQLTHDHPKSHCNIVGGAGKQLYNSTTKKCDCVQQCNTWVGTNPNAQCTWGNEVFHEHPTGNCHIKGGCGAVLYNQTTSSYQCNVQCQAFLGSNPKSACWWNGQLTHDHPKATCYIAGGAGKLLYNGTTKKCDCVSQCSSWTQTNPNCNCAWGGDVIK